MRHANENVYWIVNYAVSNRSRILYKCKLKFVWLRIEHFVVALAVSGNSFTYLMTNAPRLYLITFYLPFESWMCLLFQWIIAVSHTTIANLPEMYRHPVGRESFLRRFYSVVGICGFSCVFEVMQLSLWDLSSHWNTSMNYAIVSIIIIMLGAFLPRSFLRKMTMAMNGCKRKCM